MSRTLIEVQKNGATMYVRSVSMFAQDGLTANPAEATDYTGKEKELAHDLASIVAPGDEVYAKSGLRVDALPQVVQAEISVSIISRKLGREARKAPPRASSTNAPSM